MCELPRKKGVSPRSCIELTCGLTMVVADTL